ncbi:MAG: DUF3990 domain-containing protein [Muribaculaceae bacterium]|nr:DUF3990 domain-containing protein [Muribaculaceae bacterium]
MILYHGSNVGINAIDLSRGRRGKDFGKGFYLSPNYEQALMMAQRTVAREEEGEAVVTQFEFDEQVLQSSCLSIKVFEGYTVEWAEFIMLNRRNKTNVPAHGFDIVYGPIANDRVGLQINRYMLHYIPIDELIRQLAFIRPTYQYYFGTQRAIDLLVRID